MCAQIHHEKVAARYEEVKKYVNHSWFLLNLTRSLHGMFVLQDIIKMLNAKLQTRHKNTSLNSHRNKYCYDFLWIASG